MSSGSLPSGGLSGGGLPSGLASDLGFIESQPRFPPKTLVGDFELENRIGRGGYGEVYLAKNTQYNRRVALKFTPRVGAAGVQPETPMPAGDVETQQHGGDDNALREVVAAVMLNLPNFVTVYNLWTEGVIYPPGWEIAVGPEETFIEMEYAGGRNLAAWRGRAGLRQVVEWIVPVCRSIDAAHQLGGLTHYDLKPANILLVDPRPGAAWADLVPDRLTPKVGDFGLARLTDHTGQFPRGTDGFAPPDQRLDPVNHPLRDDPRRRAAAIDGFALAATVVAMFYPEGAGPGPVGDEPYSVPNLDRLAAVGADRDLIAVLRKQLDPDPRQRYETVGAFAKDLERWLNREAVAARNYRGGVIKAWKRQAWWVKGLAALLPVAVLGGVSAWAAFEGEKGRRAAADADRQRAEAARLAAEVDALDKQKKLAEQERITAVVETAGQKQLAHEKVVVAARSAARRGNWPDAKRDYDAAIADGFDDARRLRVERLAVYFGLNDTATLERELTHLEAMPDLGPLAAPVRLHRGTLLMCDVERVEDGRRALEESLAAARKAGPGALRDLFTPADAAYAAALLEKKPNPVVVGLERAIALDPLHQPAQHALLVTLIASGQLDRARVKLAEVERLFPASTVPPVVHGLIAAIDMNPGVFRDAVVWAAARQYEARRGAAAPALEEFLAFFAQSIDLSVETQKRPGRATREQQQAFSAALVNLGQFAGRAFGPTGLPLPNAHFVERWLEDLQPLDGLLWRGDDEAYERVREMLADYPDALVRSVAATNRFLAALPLANRQEGTPADLARARALLSTSAAHAEDASTAPYLFARTPQRYISRAFGLLADLVTLLWTPDPDPVHFRRLRENLHRLVTDARGQGWDEQRDFGIGLFIRMLTAGSFPWMVADWHLDTPEGRAAFRARKGELYALARGLLDAWKADGPPSKPYREASGILEDWARAEWLLGLPPVAPPPRAK